MNLNEQKKRETLVYQLGKNYTYQDVDYLYQAIAPTLNKSLDILVKHGLKAPKKPMQKNEILQYVIACIMDVNFCKKFVDSLSTDVKIIFNHVVWWRSCSNVTVEQLINKQLFSFKTPHPINLHHLRYSEPEKKDFPAEYRFFTIQYYVDYKNNQLPQQYDNTVPPGFILSLPYFIRHAFRQVLDPPKQFKLTTTDDVKDGGTLFQNEGHILNHLTLGKIFIEQQLLQISKQGKPLKTTIKKLRNAISYKEFYPDAPKGVGDIYSELLVAMLLLAKKNKKDDIMSQLKQIISCCFDGKSVHYLNLLLHHLNGRGSISNYGGELDIDKNIFKLLKVSPENKWILFENWLQFIFLHDIDVEYIDPGSASRYLYYGKKYDATDIADEETYIATITIPFLKGMLFLMAVLGVVDITYQTPKNTDLHKKDLDYMSIYDGLLSFRLTQLGAYLLGLRSDYVAPVDNTEKANVIIDDSRLLITFHGEDPLKSMILEQMSHKVGNNRYKMDYESFLKGCDKTDSIKNKITQFKQHISASPPKIWENFFNSVLSQYQPLHRIPSAVVFKIADNPQLIQHIARDTILKKYILKAEQHHLIIEKKHYSKVQERLITLGYLL